jgi:hypothetical protein
MPISPPAAAWNCEVGMSKDYKEGGKRPPPKPAQSKKSTLLRGIHISPTHTVGKALSIFFWKVVHFGFLRNLFRLL